MLVRKQHLRTSRELCWLLGLDCGTVQTLSREAPYMQIKETGTYLINSQTPHILDTMLDIIVTYHCRGVGVPAVAPQQAVRALWRT